MRYAINAPNFGTFADPRLVAELAAEAEQAGWDGFFLWDHILGATAGPVADPWVLLSAMALTTSRIKLGTLVTPLPRRAPWKLAREAVTLDHLSNGRLILGAGAGDDSHGEYSSFGLSGDARTRAEMLEEGLAVLEGLWRGERFSFAGKHYKLQDVVFQPRPLQTPRIPIWVAGSWPARGPFRRAAAWDGVAAIGRDGPLTPEDCRQIAAFVSGLRNGAPFDITIVGWTPGSDREKEGRELAPYAEAGVTWFQVGLLPDRPADEVRARIRLGPPL